jgi:hypothetical protein
MIAGENGDPGALQSRRMAILPAAQPLAQLFQPGQRPRRLGQLPLALPGPGGCLVGGSGQVAKNPTNLPQRTEFVAHAIPLFALMATIMTLLYKTS